MDAIHDMIPSGMLFIYKLSLYMHKKGKTIQIFLQIKSEKRRNPILLESDIFFRHIILTISKGNSGNENKSKIGNDLTVDEIGIIGIKPVVMDKTLHRKR